MFIISVIIDDLFDDEEEDSAPVNEKALGGDKDGPKKKYLEQKWKLNSEDAKDFKGFPTKDGASGSNAVTTDVVPCFALMYKFRKEYIEGSVDAVLADHKGHCAKFKRLLNTEIINLGKAKGVVLLWAGFDDDKEETREEIMTFLEDDPFITKDYVENWDLIDLLKTDVDAEAETVDA